eukprot:7390281-Prymnesium_polylepis.2
MEPNAIFSKPLWNIVATGANPEGVPPKAFARVRGDTSASSISNSHSTGAHLTLVLHPGLQALSSLVRVCLRRSTRCDCLAYPAASRHLMSCCRAQEAEKSGFTGMERDRQVSEAAQGVEPGGCRLNGNCPALHLPACVQCSSPLHPPPLLPLAA